MKLFLSYLRLIRPFNLIMIVFTLYGVRFLFHFSGYTHSGGQVPVGELCYAIFSLSFVFMAAGGYIINDYYDVAIDKINRPSFVIIGTMVSTRSALTAYWILSILGTLAGFWSCYWAGIPLVAFLFVFYWVGLWFYSYKLKSTFLAGNILIALFLALVPLGGACIELCPKAATILFTSDEKYLLWKMLEGISLFAFMSALIREIVKDAEDMEGDAAAGCTTMPIVIGIKATKWIVFSLVLLFNALLIYIQTQFSWMGIYLLLYFLLFIQAPLIWVIYLLIRSSSPKGFHRISFSLKALMVTGMLYVFAIAIDSYLIYQFFANFSKLN